ncbi:N-acetylmuramoyl-L-alanine amidase [Haladaptatus caseinilyticus]|uniref:N-acetylmuramoyl-L-alanine amidase n=1 Tax=Haladaptatus caseinilyticus TaxID=2993314 RepID=UPI00224A94BA|nr:N-acetylmuramoyl-L-alanine amidase [Haladaptatus caseinilyticus]
MTPSRRQFLKLTGATASTGAILASASPVSAHAKPNMRWVAADSSNYDDGRYGENINWYIVHVAEGSYSGTINWFQNPDADASTHYVIENKDDPEITRMVDESDTAWHAGNWEYNKQSLGIEHPGYTGETTFVDGMYEKSAEIAQWAAETYNFPLRVRRYDVAPCNPSDDGGIIGHDQIPDPNNCSAGGGAGRHGDPGSTWNWGRYEGYLRRFHMGAGQHVVTSSDLNVRDSPNGSAIDTAPDGTAGEILSGPVNDGGYEWYEVDYEGSTQTGWSAADWLLYARFGPSDSVTTTSALSVRTSPDGTKIDTASNGEGGTILDGPVDSGGYRWWKVDYDSAQTGWSAGYWLQ